MTAHQLRIRVEDVQADAWRILARFHQLAREDREDIAQEAVVRALTRATTNPGGLARTAARRLAIDLLRQRRANPGRDLLWESARIATDSIRHVDLAHDAARALQVARTAPAAHAAGVTALVMDTDAPVGHARDAFYKRRYRAAAWLRAALEAP